MRALIHHTLRLPHRRLLASAIAAICAATLSVGVTIAHAEAEQKSEQKSDANAAALNAWSQAVGADAPAVIRQADGSSKLEWQLQATTDSYTNRVKTLGNAVVNSSLQEGNHVKNSLGFNLKSIDTNNPADQASLQGALLDTNDRSALGKYRNQVTSFQIGRTTGSYYIFAGDVAANFSPLSSNLGLRGLMGQLKIGYLMVTTHVGTIAESWDALTNRTTLTGAPARTNYLRDVYGVKTEYEVTKETKLFVTTQGYSDRTSSLGDAANALKPAETQSSTIGFSYQRDALQLIAETAMSRFGTKTEQKRDGNATTLAGTYRSGNFSWRAGHNKIGSLFASLASAAAPGVEETYLGTDWQTVPSVTVGVDLRQGANRVASTAISEATKSPFTALNSRLQWNLARWVDGLNMQLQDTRSENKTPTGVKRNNDTSNIGFSFSRSGWSSSINAGHSSSKDAGNPAGDSVTNSAQLALGRQINSDPQSAKPWSIGLGANLSSQKQRITASGMQTRTDSLGVTFSGRYHNWGNMNASAQLGTTSQPMGGSDLKQLTYQLDLAYPITKAAAIKLQGRYTERNGGSSALKTVEQSGGATFALNF